MSYQKILGIIIPEDVSYSPLKGPTARMRLRAPLTLEFNPAIFTHLLVVGGTNMGKGVFCSTFGLYMKDNHNFKFIDFNDPDGYYENGYYSWPQEDPTMLARLDDTFPWNEPHGYEHEMLVPCGALGVIPSFFKEFTICYKDITPFDFTAYYPKGASEEDMELCSLLEDCDSLKSFLKGIYKHGPVKSAYPLLEYLALMGVLTEEPTTLDFDRLADHKIVHSFSMASIPDKRARNFLTNLVIRLIHDSRIGESYQPCCFYIREVGTIDQTIARLLATRGRHAGVSFIADTQRRTTLMDKTTGMQFSSQVLFHMNQEEGEEMCKATGIHTKFARKLPKANTGVALLNLVGTKEPVFPMAVSPPVCSYRTKSANNYYPNYFKVCQEHGVEFKDGSKET